jgi:hypothetical protein
MRSVVTEGPEGSYDRSPVDHQGPVCGWIDPAIGAGCTLAALAFAFLLRWERHHPAPLLPPRLFADRRFTAGAAALAWMFFALLDRLAARGRPVGDGGRGSCAGHGAGLGLRCGGS